MKITDRLLESIAGGMIDRKVGEKVEKLKEALIIPQDGIDKDEHLWRLLTKNKDRNLDPLTQDRMIEIAVWLNTMNGFAHRILEMNKDFVIGDGIRYEAKDSTVREILDEHWYDSVNNWSLKQFNRVMELGLYGEQLFPVFVNEHNGFVRLGIIDPSQISKITVNPENIEEMQKVILKTGSENIDKPKEYKVIALDMNPNSESYGYRTGEAFFFAVNKLSTATRGISDLLSVADWIDGYERFLFNRLDRSHLLNQFIWDILLEDYTPEQIKDWMKEFSMPKPGSVRAHNQKVKWDVVSPKLESADASEEAKMFKSHILGQAGFPPHFFAEGEGITRATATEMGTPVFKRLKARQTYVKYMVTEIFAFVIDQAILHGRLKPDVDRSFSLFFPKLAEKDFSSLSTAITNLSSALVVGEDQQWITKDWAKKAYLFILSQFGFDMKIEEGPITDMSESTYEFKEYLQAKVKEARLKLKKSTEKKPEEENADNE